MTKKQQVLEYLQNHKGGITSMQAINMFKATRLSAIVYELKQENWDIRTIMERNTDCDGSHARYILMGKLERFPNWFEKTFGF